MANNVTTYHYDNGRTGWNQTETFLAPAIVSNSNFGLLFQQSVDDLVYAQPLYVEGLVIGGTTRNVVFVGTEAGTVYAFDADSSNNWMPLWQLSLVGAGETRSNFFGVITATPVIDVGSSTIYVLGYYQDQNTKYFFRLHAIDIMTGKTVNTSAQIKALSPVVEVAGTGAPQDPNNPGMVYFDPANQFNRAALLLAYGNVYAAFASHSDQPPFHGWVLGFNSQTLQLIGPPFCSTPDASQTPNFVPPPGGSYLDDPELGGSFWMAGWGLAADGDGYIYGITGNGLFIDPNIPHPHLNYGDSMVKLDKSLNLVGSFTPANYATLAAQDTDFGSAGPVVIPDAADGGRLEIIGCGKDANVYLVDRGAMTPPNLHRTGTQLFQLALAPSASPQPITLDGSGPGVWGGPAYYGGPLGNIVYYCGTHGPLQAIAIHNGVLTPHMVAPGVPNQTPPSETFPNEGGVIPVVTSNGSSPHSGIVWAVTRPEGTVGLRLRAYNAEDLTKPALISIAIGSWTGRGAFLAPIVVNGKVYVGSDHRLSVYGIGVPGIVSWPSGTTINTVDSTPQAPAACVLQNQLYLFWKANDPSNDIYYSASADGQTWPSGRTINNVDSTPQALATCVFQNQLYLLWKANDPSNKIFFSA